MSVNITIDLKLPMATVATIQKGGKVNMKDLLSSQVAAQITDAVRALPFQVNAKDQDSSEDSSVARPSKKRRQFAKANTTSPPTSVTRTLRDELAEAEAQRRMWARMQERVEKTGTPGMQMFVKMLTGKTKTFEVHPTTPIREVKTIIEECEGIPLNLQRLIFAGKQLDSGPEDDDFDEQQRLTLADVSIDFPMIYWSLD